MQSTVGGYPQFKRHLAAIHRMPATHAPVRKFHASDIVYAMLRRGIGRSMLNKGLSSPSADRSLSFKSGIPSLKSNSMWKSTLRRGY